MLRMWPPWMLKIVGLCRKPMIFIRGWWTRQACPCVDAPGCIGLTGSQEKSKVPRFVVERLIAYHWPGAYALRRRSMNVTSWNPVGSLHLRVVSPPSPPHDHLPCQEGSRRGSRCVPLKLLPGDALINTGSPHTNTDGRTLSSTPKGTCEFLP